MNRMRIMTVVLFVAACSGERDGAFPGDVTVDTLPGGALVVRNPATGVWAGDPAAGWRVVEEARIGRIEGDGPDVFGFINSVIEGPLGRVWVADAQAHEIRIFDSDGRWVRSIGRQGGGPGEFGRLASLHPGPDGNIWVDDAGLRRWEIFDSAGVRVAGHPGNSNLGGGLRRWTADGRLMEVSLELLPGSDFTQTRAYYSIRQFDGSGLGAPDTVQAPATGPSESVRFRNPSGRVVSTLGLPLHRNPLTVLGYHGDFWVTDGGDAYSIRRVSLEGDTLLVIHREYEPVPVTPAAREAALASLRPREGLTSDDNDPGRVPTVYPPFDYLHPATDGTLWVRRTLAGDRLALDVFSADGVYLGQVDAPPDIPQLRVSHITADRIYGVVSDDLGVQYVVVLRIERPTR